MNVKKTTATVVAVVIVLICLTVCLTGCEDKGYTWLDSVKIVARLTESGDLVVSETWNAVITEDEVRNLYRNIDVRDPEFDVKVEIADVGVVDGDGLSYTELRNPSNPSGSNANRGAENVYYVYDYGNSTVEIGCYFARVDYTEKTVTFNYTLRNMARKYNDCVELYWRIFDEDFSLYVKDLSVELYLPNGEKITDETYFWLHTEVDESNTENQSDRMVFSAEKLSTGNYFEIRALTPVSLYADVAKTRNESVVESIYQTELAEYEAYQAEIKKRHDLGIFSIVASCLLVVGGVAFAVFFPRFYRKSKGQYPEYVREIPAEFTAAEAGHFFYYYTGGGKGARNRGKLFSATILDLARKGYVAIEPTSDGKKYTLAVVDVSDAKREELRDHEECLLSLIGRVEASVGHPFMPDEFTSYAKTHYEDVNSTLNEFLSDSSGMLKNGKCIDAKNNPAVFTVAGIVLAVLGLWLFADGVYMNFLGLGLIAFGVIMAIFAPKVPKLTQKGEEKYELTQGLKRFMLDFTNLKEHELPALILWEEYMVYATMMGISEAVLKNLKLKYPELTSEENTSYGGYYYGRRNFIFTYYMLSGRASYDLGRSLDNCFTNVSATAKAIKMSTDTGSGKGGSFGGGFGHGGGGFGGGGGGFGGGGGGAR